MHITILRYPNIDSLVHEMFPLLKKDNYKASDEYNDVYYWKVENKMIENILNDYDWLEINSFIKYSWILIVIYLKLVENYKFYGPITFIIVKYNNTRYLQSFCQQYNYKYRAYKSNSTIN